MEQKKTEKTVRSGKWKKSFSGRQFKNGGFAVVFCAIAIVLARRAASGHRNRLICLKRIRFKI